MIENIKILLGITDASKDALLNILVNDAKTYAVEYCNLTEYIEALNSVVVNMVIENYNRLGAEGINTRNYGGISETYALDYSQAIYKRLAKFKRLRSI